jgi:hypothetical protein
MVEVRVPGRVRALYLALGILFLAFGLFLAGMGVLGLASLAPGAAVALLVAALVLAVAASILKYLKYARVVARADADGLTLERDGQTERYAWHEIGLVKDMRLSKTTAIFHRNGRELVRVYWKLESFPEFLGFVFSKLAEEAEESGDDRPLAESTTRAVKQSNLAFYAIPAIGLFMIVTMVASGGYRDIVLRCAGTLTLAKVDRLERQAGGAGMREPDVDVYYTFHDGRGALWQGRDVLPPRLARGELDEVEISYWETRPRVSRIRSQVSFMPLNGVILGGFILAWWAFTFWRLRRARRQEREDVAETS